MSETRHEETGAIDQQFDDALSLNENLLHTLVSNAPVGVCLTDIHGRCRYVNHKWCEMAGMKLEEALGDGWIAALHPEDRERVHKEWNRLNVTEWGWKREYRFQTSGGKITWIAEHTTKLQGKKGSTIGYLSININISSTKNVEMALRASEERYRTTIDAISDGIHVVNKDLVITMNNSTIARWAQEMGLSGILAGKTPFKVFPFLSKQAEDEYRQVFQTGEVLATELLSRKMGWHWLSTWTLR